MKYAYAAALAAVVSCGASADFVGVVGGQTNVLLDFDLIEGATGLAFDGVSEGVIAPGNLGPGSVAFGITSPYAAGLPTTFNYDSSDFGGTFAGSIEHRGAVFFSGAADVTVGNFSIAYDLATSGFQVIDTLDLGIALFDVELTDATPAVDTFEVNGNLLISGAFAEALIQLELTTADLTGVDVGDAYIQGLNQAVPTPGVLALAAIGAVGTRRRRRE